MTTAEIKLVVLFESELRLAARLLHEVVEAHNAISGDNDEEASLAYSRKAFEALNASLIALHGLHDTDNYAVAMVSTPEQLIGAQAKKRKRK